jgi:hypothetical protein
MTVTSRTWLHPLDLRALYCSRAVRVIPPHYIRGTDEYFTVLRTYLQVGYGNVMLEPTAQERTQVGDRKTAAVRTKGTPRIHEEKH